MLLEINHNVLWVFYNGCCTAFVTWEIDLSLVILLVTCYKGAARCT
jgi:hypothetical protein